MTALQEFTSYLDEKQVKYIPDEDGRRVLVVFGAKNAQSIKTQFIFGEDGKDVGIRIFSICEYPPEKLPVAYAVCSKLNAKFRWIKFYIDSDNEMTAADDAVIQAGGIGAECFELLLRSISIVDDAYPVIMQALWA